MRAGLSKTDALPAPCEKVTDFFPLPAKARHFDDGARARLNVESSSWRRSAAKAEVLEHHLERW
jgi:hypothetical protein